MLTGSLAMSYYAEPRMTRDVDVVISVEPADVDSIVALLDADYYIDSGAVAEAIASCGSATRGQSRNGATSGTSPPGRSAGHTSTNGRTVSDWPARELVLASFPPGLTAEQARQQLFARLYGDVRQEHVPPPLRGG